jgi:hypothetical protein
MIDERKYWEEVIASAFLIFATYTIIKDLLDEKPDLILLPTQITVNTLIYAVICVVILFLTLKLILIIWNVITTKK